MGVAGAGFLVYLIVQTGRVRSDVVKIKERDEVENKICCLLWPDLAWVAVSSNVWARTF
jgi:hypothetical protein